MIRAAGGLFMVWLLWPACLLVLVPLACGAVIEHLEAGAVERYKRVQRLEESERTCYTGKR